VKNFLENSYFFITFFKIQISNEVFELNGQILKKSQCFKDLEVGIIERNKCARKLDTIPHKPTHHYKVRLG